MKSRHVTRYICDHCNKGWWIKSKCARHEDMCLKNPDRVCGACKERNLLQRPLQFFLDHPAARLNPSIGDWYGDVDKLREMAQGCPLCMLAAKMAMDDEIGRQEGKWTDFDYNKEMERWRLEAYPSGIPF